MKSDVVQHVDSRRAVGLRPRVLSSNGRRRADDAIQTTPATSRMRYIYAPEEVRALLEGYAALLQLAAWRPAGNFIHVRLLDLERALERIPVSLYEPLEWHGLKRLTLDEVEVMLGGKRTTVHDRYQRGINSVIKDLNKGSRRFVLLQRALTFYRSVGATRYIREGEALRSDAAANLPNG
jgi:hypothetical protein